MDRPTGGDRDGSEDELTYTPEELERQCQLYFSSCEEGGRKCTKPGLILYLNITEGAFNAWLNNERDRYTRLSQVLIKAMLRIRDDLEQRSDSMSLFRLKQPCYGGYADRPAENGGGGISVTVTFGGGDAEAAAEYVK